MTPYRVRRLAATTSTNDDAVKAAEAGEAEGLVIHALKQTAGRGRHGRVWESPEGNLYCSVVLRPPGERRGFGRYSFVAALALGETVKEFLPQAAVTFKWPNDVLVDGKKIGGILLESGEDWLVIGMGLNVLHYPADALYPSTSLIEKLHGSKSGLVLPPLRGELEGGSRRNPDAGLGGNHPHPTSPVEGEEHVRSDLDSAHVLQKLLDRLWHWYEITQKEGFTPIRAAWLEQAQKGRMTVKLLDRTVEGEFIDIDTEGHLRLRLADGTERILATGDVFFA